MVDKKLSSFSQITPAEISKLICLFLDQNNAIKNGVVDFASLDALLAHKAGDETFTGNKTFSGDTVFSGNATFNNAINANISGNAATATNATKAAKDGSGNNIVNTYATKYALEGQRTNCITEIPQDIKLELNNGTLTLKAGSKVYVPNGSGVFDTVTIASDVSFSNTSLGNRTALLVYRKNNNDLQIPPISSCSSGTSTPSSGWYYNTTDNKIYRDGSYEGGAFPLAVITYLNGSGVTSIDQVFNGFGYIGSTVFALPGVKGLIPNGRNDDGTLKNIEFLVNGVKTVNLGVNQTGYSITLNSGGLYSLSKYQEVNTPVSGYVNYIASENKIYNGVNQRFWAYVCSYSTNSNGVITSFNPKTVFHAVDYYDVVKYSDKEMITGWGMPNYSSGVSVTWPDSSHKYTAPSNGLLIMSFYYNTDDIQHSYINNIQSPYTYTDRLSGDLNMQYIIPLNKNDVFYWDFTLSNNIQSCSFYPSKGG